MKFLNSGPKTIWQNIKSTFSLLKITPLYCVARKHVRTGKRFKQDGIHKPCTSRRVPCRRRCRVWSWTLRLPGSSPSPPSGSDIWTAFDAPAPGRWDPAHSAWTPWSRTWAGRNAGPVAGSGGSWRGRARPWCRSRSAGPSQPRTHPDVPLHTEKTVVI